MLASEGVTEKLSSFFFSAALRLALAAFLSLSLPLTLSLSLPLASSKEPGAAAEGMATSPTVDLTWSSS